MTWAWKQQLPPTEKYVLIALADHANDEDFTCWPSLNHLQKKTGLSRPAIWKTIDRLSSAGAIERIGTKVETGSTIYKVMIGNVITLDNHVTQVTTLPKLGNQGNRVGNQGNKLGNDVTPNHKNHHESSVTIAPNGADDPPKQKKPRPPDPLWDAMLAACGLNGASPTPGERGAWNKAVQDLRTVNATPAEIQARGSAYRKRWPNVSLTPTALARRWSECVATTASNHGVSTPRLPDDYYQPDGTINPKYGRESSA